MFELNHAHLALARTQWVAAVVVSLLRANLTLHLYWLVVATMLVALPNVTEILWPWEILDLCWQHWSSRILLVILTTLTFFRHLCRYHAHYLMSNGEQHHGHR